MTLARISTLAAWTILGGLMGCGSSDSGGGSPADGGVDTFVPADVADTSTDTAPPPDTAPETSSDTCGSGAATSAFDASPTAGQACNPSGALTKDGVFAGLDLPTTGSPGTIDGQSVAGCVGVDFGAAKAFGDVTVRAAPSTDACSASPCIGASCDTADEFLVFQGTTMGTYTFVTRVTLGSKSVTDYPVTLGATAQFIVVCRPGNDAAHDDVIVDAILDGAPCP